MEKRGKEPQSIPHLWNSLSVYPVSLLEGAKIGVVVVNQLYTVVELFRSCSWLSVRGRESWVYELSRASWHFEPWPICEKWRAALPARREYQLSTETSGYICRAGYSPAMRIPCYNGYMGPDHSVAASADVPICNLSAV